MKSFGIDYQFQGNTIKIPNQNYIARDYFVEADWSSASYLYSIAAMAENAELEIYGLKEKSLQADSAIHKIMENFGIKTEFINNGLLISKNHNLCSEFEYDFSDCPDIAQTIAVLCVAKGIKARLSGLESLRIKETDRIQALINELSKIGADIREAEPGSLKIEASASIKSNIEIETYEDHRMAMAFAPLALKSDSIIIKEAGVVSKSYPDYWNDLEKMGFDIYEK